MESLLGVTFNVERLLGVTFNVETFSLFEGFLQHDF